MLGLYNTVWLLVITMPWVLIAFTGPSPGAVAAIFMSLSTIPVMFLVAKDTLASMAFVAHVLMRLLGRFSDSIWRLCTD
jgi:hypothetical protein